MHNVYILKSLKDFKRYVGSTDDVSKRLAEHNSGKVRSTKSRRPFELVYKEVYATKTEALKREHFLKSGQGRKLLDEKLR
jgi:putative endonuclease